MPQVTERISPLVSSAAGLLGPYVLINSCQVSSLIFSGILLWTAPYFPSPTSVPYYFIRAKALSLIFNFALRPLSIVHVLTPEFSFEFALDNTHTVRNFEYFGLLSITLKNSLRVTRAKKTPTS